MPQLSTTYDSKLKKKIFVLRGSEGYATTTDVVANLITDFDDYDTHISYCHVGLEIQVLRELGESTLYIYNGDELLYSIPWVDDGMDEVIDSDWNNKGVYWDDTNGKLIIGKKDDDYNINTGLFLLYDVEHSIKVQYLGNKRCLGSHCKPIVFTVPTPDTFESTLTLSTSTPSYVVIDDVTNVKLLLESQNSLTTEKDVRIYIDDVLFDTVGVEQDIQLTLDLSDAEIVDGLHTIKAVFDGDDEAYGSKAELNISLGYKVSNLNYPSVLVSGDTASVTCQISDFFDNPYGGQATIQEYIPNWGWDEIAPSVFSDSDGIFTFNPTYLSNRPFAVTVSVWHSGQYTTNVVTINNISISLLNSPVYSNVSTGVSGRLLDGSTEVKQGGVPIDITYTDLDGNETTYSTTTDSNGIYTDRNYYGSGKGIVTATVTVRDTQITNSLQMDDLLCWWSTTGNVQSITSLYPTYVGVTLSKQSNGFKLMSNSDDGNVRFAYFNLVDYTTEFDVVGFSLDDSDTIMGKPFDTLDFSVGSHIKIIHFKNGDVEFYINNTLVDTYNYPLHLAFAVYMDKNEYLTINNLKIERTG